ncbi:hypothetical protein, partial [Rhodococcus wratislaviensis]|uniref:hypothetical protein n=1 Tax=Rhodococcus wratislaviensis TaxID=44752 RepID=UPI001788BE43
EVLLRHDLPDVEALCPAFFEYRCNGLELLGNNGVAEVVFVVVVSAPQKGFEHFGIRFRGLSGSE